ncbi:hypothetical protein [Parageobacillus thermoglucosidasius]|uniref:hypothetical protein n=1 Tax=Parageobacillus thermoglucosidasius TaxID=1426 RepID=UPI0001D16B8D|nr:hypothetical protein [Parageobacillus thermoglucosidasius]
MAAHLEEVIGDPDIVHSHNVACLSQAILTVYTGALIQPAYAKLFKGLSEEKIDDIMQSFAFKNCKINYGLLDILKKYANQSSISL